MAGPKPSNIEELKKAVLASTEQEFTPDEKYLEIKKRYFNTNKKMEDIWKDITDRTGGK